MECIEWIGNAMSKLPFDAFEVREWIEVEKVKDGVASALYWDIHLE